MRAHGSHRLLALGALLLGASGCGEKANAAGGDGGSAAVLSASIDGGDGGGRGDGGAIDDTAMPSANSEQLAARMRHLLEAVAQNNPDLANDVVFPRDAYTATKDLADPSKAWDKRVQGAFRRHVERLHKHMKGVEHAKFVSFELGHAVLQITPKKKNFKKPLWRVKHSTITFTIDGKTRHLEIAEMTAWRGSWYVTRLR